MKKDYLAFNRFILTQENLSLEEGYMMNVLFQCHNETLGYAYPSYKALMKYCKTNRQAKVSKIIKSLADKGYITIQNHKNNRYFINGINEFIQGSNNENNDSNNTDSNNNSNDTNSNNNSNNTNNKDNNSNNNNTNSEFDGLTVSQTNTLMKLAKTKERLKEIIEYSKDRAKNLFAYCYRLLKDNIQVNTSYSYASNNYGNQNNNISTPKGYNSFNNFKARDYDYEDLEWRLLGWK